MKKILLGAALIVASVTAQAERWVEIDQVTSVKLSSMQDIGDGVITVLVYHHMIDSEEYDIWIIREDIDCANSAMRPGPAIFIRTDGSKENRSHSNVPWRHPIEGSKGIKIIEEVCS